MRSGVPDTIWEIVLWLAVQALLHEVQVSTRILAVSFGYEIVGRGPGGERLPLRVAMWRALRSAAVAVRWLLWRRA